MAKRTSNWIYRFSLLFAFYMTSGIRLGPADKESILQLHFNVRNRVKPKPRRMNILQYSDQLEGFAEKWANRCEWEFPDALEHPDIAELGMNIAAIGREDRKPNLQEFFEVWLREARYYTFRTNTCTAFCQHYTQIIWDDTEEVGCALHFCNGTADARMVFVCLYRPPGNFEGQWPYDPAEAMELGSDEAGDDEDRDEDEEAEGGHRDDDDGDEEENRKREEHYADGDSDEDDDDDDACTWSV